MNIQGRLKWQRIAYTSSWTLFSKLSRFKDANDQLSCFHDRRTNRLAWLMNPRHGRIHVYIKSCSSVLLRILSILMTVSPLRPSHVLHNTIWTLSNTCSSRHERSNWAHNFFKFTAENTMFRGWNQLARHRFNVTNDMELRHHENSRRPFLV